MLCLQEDEDGHLVVLQIIQDLMEKAQDAFLDHFARLGVFSKVLALVGPRDGQDSVVSAAKEEVSFSPEFYMEQVIKRLRF